MSWSPAGYVALGFLSGSIPWSWIIGRLMGTDIRKTGSGNAGATNLSRACGRPAGIAGLLLDAAKGALPVHLAGSQLLWTVPDPVLAASLTAVAAVLGHVFSPWLGFRGGKGVATMLGAMLVLAPATVGISAGVFLLVFILWRFVSLASICGAVTMIPVVFLIRTGEPSVQAVIILLALVVVIRHASNIRRLLRGEEKRFWGKGAGDDR